MPSREDKNELKVTSSQQYCWDWTPRSDSWFSALSPIAGGYVKSCKVYANVCGFLPTPSRGGCVSHWGWQESSAITDRQF